MVSTRGDCNKTERHTGAYLQPESSCQQWQLEKNLSLAAHPGRYK